MTIKGYIVVAVGGPADGKRFPITEAQLAQEKFSIRVMHAGPYKGLAETVGVIMPAGVDYHIGKVVAEDGTILPFLTPVGMPLFDTMTALTRAYAGAFGQILPTIRYRQVLDHAVIMLRDASKGNFAPPHHGKQPIRQEIEEFLAAYDAGEFFHDRESPNLWADRDLSGILKPVKTE